MTTATRKFTTKDEAGLDALMAANLAEAHLVLLRSTLPVDALVAFHAVVKELLWVTESRARWMTACSTQQISIHEEDHDV